MKDFKKKVVAGFAWEGGTKLVVQIMSWASTVIVARLLTPEDYGIVAVSGVFVLLMSIFSDMGLTAGMINKKELSEKEVTGVFWLGIIISLSLYSVVALSAPLIEDLFEMEGLANLMRVAALILIFSSVRFVPSARIMRDMNFKFRATVDMLGQFIMVVTTITLAYLEYGPWSLILGSVAMHLVITIAYIPYMKGIGFYALHWQEIKHVTNYGAKVMVSRLMAYLTRSMPTFFIGLLLGQKSTGYYSLSEQVSKIPLDKIGVIFNRIIFPATSRIKDNVEYSGQFFIKLHKVLFLIASPILIGISFISHDVIILLFTEKWASSIPILQLTSILNVFLVSVMVMPPMIEGLGKPNIVVKYNVLTLIMLTIATVIGLQWGMVEMIYGWFFVYPLTYLYIVNQVTKLLNISIYTFIGSLKSVLIALTIMSVVLFFEKSLIEDIDILYRLVITILTGAVVYGGVLYIGFKSELLQIVSHLKQAKA